MKKITTYFFILTVLICFGSCMKENSNHYPGFAFSPYIACLDLRNIYQGEDVTLTKDAMGGATTLAVIVVSEHSGNNLPQGLLVVQDARRLSTLRGISINIGDSAKNYHPGDSVTINIEGGKLTRVNGILEVTGVAPSAITRISSGNTIPVNRVPSSSILAAPNDYESQLCVIVKATYNPVPAPTDTYAGDKVLNDGFGNITLHTEKTATFANNTLTYSGNYYTIPFNVIAGKTAGGKDSLLPQLRLRTLNDVVSLGSATATIPSIIITGFFADPAGTDANAEYIQFIATKDINFSATPFTVITTNNAGASTPTGNPTNGWVTGGLRTYQISLTSGTAAKGTFFYVGGTSKVLNGPTTTSNTPGNFGPAVSIASSNWIASVDYTTKTGANGNGAVTTNLLANSGNASGIAVFQGTAIDSSSIPIDVVFIATGGTLYSAGPPAIGYHIANTDWYDLKNPITLVDQPYYRAGTNTIALAYPAVADEGFFQQLGGVFNVTLGKWTTARNYTNNSLLINKGSAGFTPAATSVSVIEGAGATKLVQ